MSSIGSAAGRQREVPHAGFVVGYSVGVGEDGGAAFLITLPNQRMAAVRRVVGIGSKGHSINSIGVVVISDG